jgi:cytochrome c oxidase subunit 1
VVGSILFGEKVTAANAQPLAPAPPDAAAIAEYGNAGTFHLPGTYVLVSVFFTAFVLYYFVNWKYLSEIWPLS